MSDPSSIIVDNLNLTATNDKKRGRSDTSENPNTQTKLARQDGKQCPPPSYVNSQATSRVLPSGPPPSISVAPPELSSLLNLAGIRFAKKKPMLLTLETANPTGSPSSADQPPQTPPATLEDTINLTPLEELFLHTAQQLSSVTATHDLEKLTREQWDTKIASQPECVYLVELDAGFDPNCNKRTLKNVLAGIRKTFPNSKLAQAYPPARDGNSKPGKHSTPWAILVTCLDAIDAAMLLVGRVWFSNQVSFQVLPTTFLASTYFGSFKGFTAAADDNEDKVNVVTAFQTYLLKASSTLHHHLVSLGLDTSTIHSIAASVTTHPIEIMEKGAREPTVKWLIYANSPSPTNWHHICANAENGKPAKIQHLNIGVGEWTSDLDGINCKICKGCDHWDANCTLKAARGYRNPRREADIAPTTARAESIADIEQSRSAPPMFQHCQHSRGSGRGNPRGGSANNDY